MLDHLHRNAGTRHSAGSMQGWGKMYDPMVALTSLGQEQKFRQATLALAKLQSGEHVLEVGCGTGSLSLAAKRQEPSIQMTGIDIATDMVEAARQKALRAGLAVSFQVGRIEAVPFPDAQFDLVLSSLMLHHLDNQAAKQQGLREVFRVLKPGGRVLIVDMAPPKNRLVRGIIKMLFGKSMLANSLDAAIPLVDRAGFVEIQSGPTVSSFLAYLSGRKP